MSSANPSPICPPVATPVPVAPEEAFVVPLVIEPAAAEKTARDAILGGLLRPEDIRDAEIEPVRLVFLPFWRVQASVSGFHIGLTHHTGQDGSLKWVLPTGGARHREAALLVMARRLFPFEPVILQVPGPFQDAFHPFAIDVSEMIPRAQYTFPEAEIVEPDVTRAMAEAEAKDRILRAVQPASALYSKYDPKVQSAALCHYPLYVARYSYDGHAAPVGHAFHVEISGKTGKIVGAKHPSAVRALARKFRKLLSFG